MLYFSLAAIKGCGCVPQKERQRIDSLACSKLSPKSSNVPIAGVFSVINPRDLLFKIDAAKWIWQNEALK